MLKYEVKDIEYKHKILNICIDLFFNRNSPTLLSAISVSNLYFILAFSKMMLK